MAKAEKKAQKAAPVTASVNISTDKVAEIVANVKQYHPHVETVYINSKGDYHYHPRPGFMAVNIDGSKIKEVAPAPAAEPVPAAPPKDGLEF